MTLRDGHYYPYDPTPVLEAYAPTLEKLGREVQTLRELWRYMAPVWKKDLVSLMRDEGMEVMPDQTVCLSGCGVILSDHTDYFKAGDNGFGPSHLLWLLAYVVRAPEDLERIVTGIEEVLRRIRRSIERLEKEAERTWTHVIPEERTITP